MALWSGPKMTVASRFRCAMVLMNSRHRPQGGMTCKAPSAGSLQTATTRLMVGAADRVLTGREFTCHRIHIQTQVQLFGRRMLHELRVLGVSLEQPFDLSLQFTIFAAGIGNKLTADVRRLLLNRFEKHFTLTARRGVHKNSLRKEKSA